MNIDHTLFTIDEQMVNEHKLDSGHCHLFAVTLGQLSGRDYTVHLGLRHIHYEDDDDFSNMFFSHAVVEINGQVYDCFGNNAIENWEAKWDQGVPDADGEISTFEWVPLSNSPDLDMVLKELNNIGFRVKSPEAEAIMGIRSMLSIGIPKKGISL